MVNPRHVPKAKEEVIKTSGNEIKMVVILCITF